MKDARPSIKTESSATVQGAPIVSPFGFPAKLDTVCAEVLRREASSHGKKIEAHWAHMVVHGALHLVGYDHERGERDRMKMERREVAVLKSFGFGNPYT